MKNIFKCFDCRKEFSTSSLESLLSCRQCNTGRYCEDCKTCLMCNTYKPYECLCPVCDKPTRNEICFTCECDEDRRDVNHIFCSQKCSFEGCLMCICSYEHAAHLCATCDDKTQRYCHEHISHEIHDETRHQKKRLLDDVVEECAKNKKFKQELLTKLILE